MTNSSINFVVALPAEAKPINRYFGLNRDNRQKQFALYTNDDISLVISGPGIKAAATATAWLHSINNNMSSSWINIGIAGHPSHEIGAIYQAEHIRCYQTGDEWDLSTYSDLCETSRLITLQAPEKEYRFKSLIEMEAAGFYRAALAHTGADRIHCLKVISDNQDNPVENINGKMVKQLIENRLDVLDRLVTMIRDKVLHDE